MRTALHIGFHIYLTGTVHTDKVAQWPGQTINGGDNALAGQSELCIDTSGLQYVIVLTWNWSEFSWMPHVACTGKVNQSYCSCSSSYWIALSN